MSYKIEKVNSPDDNIKYTVYSTDYRNPFDSLPEISSYFKSISYHGKVLFDCLTSNGNNNRFSEISFDGNSFDRNTYEDVEIPHSEFRTMLNKFYSDHFLDIDLTTCTKALKFLIQNKYCDKY